MKESKELPAIERRGSVGKESPLQQIHLKANELADRISKSSGRLISILTDYQTKDTADYEIERCIRTLRGLKENDQYLGVGKKIDSSAVMLPSNLPLYSLVVFGVIPSFLCDEVNVRPNSLLQENNIVSRICSELKLDDLFPSLNIVDKDYTGFKPYIKRASLVVFTGRPSNADKLLQEMKSNSVLVINGSGHNPVVVTDTADIDKAVEGALLVKGFNAGQDCAGPDAILVHHDVAKEFIEKFREKFSSLKTGGFKDFDTIVSPIQRLSELQKFANVFYQNRKDIISGGNIDFRTSIVSPTTIIRGIERYPNFKEMFGPVAFVHPYKKDEDLSYYFQDMDGQYASNRMYVSVFGKSDYISSRDDSMYPGRAGNVGIVLQDQTIHDVEIGYKAYGGYSLGASGVIIKTPSGTKRVAMPILIPEIISEYMIKGVDIETRVPRYDEVKKLPPSIKTGKEIDPIVASFKELVTEVFGDNMAFGFIFGSAAKGKLKIAGPDKHDLDTFICLKKDDPDAIQEYSRRIARLHHKYGLKVDEAFPMEVMTLETLETTISELDRINVSVDELVSGEKFDKIFWVHALTDQKTGFVGDGRTMSNLIRGGQPHIYRWQDQIIEQLKARETLPEHMCRTFSGLGKEEAIAKLSSHKAHLVVHLGLNYDDGSAAKEEKVKEI